MKKIRFGVIGTGWRALFYVRAAQYLPEYFELTGVLTRSQERAKEFEETHGVRAFTDFDALLETKPEFIVSCVTKAAMTDTVIRLLKSGMPALAETPLATDEEGLRRVYDAWKRTGVTLQLAEQYFLYPSHRARQALIEQGVLGEVTTCYLTMMHDYHAVSMFRRFLCGDDSMVAIRAQEVQYDIINTGDRSGYLTDGRKGFERRMVAQIVDKRGKLGVYNFSGTQYHSAIRSNHVQILGMRGEIFDDEVRYLLADNRPARAMLEYRRDEMTGTIRAIDFDGMRIYENPFRTDVAMTQDDIAVSTLLVKMGAAVRDGKLFYPMAQAFRDGYLSWQLHEAAQTGKTVVCGRMPWDDA